MWWILPHVCRSINIISIMIRLSSIYFAICYYWTEITFITINCYSICSLYINIFLCNNVFFVFSFFQVEQIQTEFKILALQFHPDKNEGNKDAEVKFQQLKEAKEILCDPERRSNYDKWRGSGLQITYKNWVGMKDSVHQVKYKIKID